MKSSSPENRLKASSLRLFKRFAIAALFIGMPLLAEALELKNGDKIAVLTGQKFETYGWAPSGYLRLITDELAKFGIKNALPICIDGKTEMMLALIDNDVIAKKPAYVLIIPGNADYNVFEHRPMDPAFNLNLETIIGKLQSAKIKTVLVTSYFTASNPANPLNGSVAEHNEAIRALARSHGVPLIDFVKVVDAEKKVLPFDGSLAAKAVVHQMFAGEVLRTLGYTDQEITARRQAWLDIPGAIQFPPSISVNTYEKLKVAAKAAGKDVNVYLTEILHKSAQ